MRKRLRIVVCCVGMLGGAVSFARPAAAVGLVFTVTPLSAEEVKSLSNEDLVKRYIDVSVELKASTTFSLAAGFTLKSYREYKRLLRYRVDLLLEMHRRGLEVPELGL